MAKWNIDPAHSGAGFAVRHFMLSNVKGLFQDISGIVNYDPDDPSAIKIDAVISTSSISTGIKDRDEHLQSGDFLDVANFPEMAFVSTDADLSDGSGTVSGDLTIRGISKPVNFDVVYFGPMVDPFESKTHIGFTATATINRVDYGMIWNAELEGGGVVVGNKVQITLDVEAIKE
ncbi:MAG: YceI family protein [bacterium]